MNAALTAPLLPLPDNFFAVIHHGIGGNKRILALFVNALDAAQWAKDRNEKIGAGPDEYSIELARLEP